MWRIKRTKMTVDRQHTEIVTTRPPAFAEGTSIKSGRENIELFKPKKSEISQMLIDEGWQPSDIDIWFDDLQGFWRWSCKIQRM